MVQRAAIERLAASPEHQRTWLRQLGTFPSLDELALGFDDDFAPARSTVDQGSALAALDAQLSLMSGAENGALWQNEALDGPAWARVRELAADALSELDS